MNTAKLATIEQVAPELEKIGKPVEPTPDHKPGDSWRPVDLSPALDGTEMIEPPTMLARTDGRCTIYPAKNHSFVGDGEAGKGWLALHACGERLTAGETVAYFDREDDHRTAVARLRALGIETDAIRSRFRYFHPEEPLSPEAWAIVAAELGTDTTLSVFDSVNEFMALHGLDPTNPTDITTWHNTGPRRIISHTGGAALSIDHVVKNSEARGKSPYGGVGKRNGVDVQYQLEVVQPFARGLDGHSELREGKDRPGYVKGELGVDDIRSKSHGRLIGIVHYRSLPDGALTVEIEPPEPVDDAETFRPTRIMEKASLAIEATPGMSQRNIRECLPHKTDIVTTALALLVQEGYVTREKKGSALAHFSANPYRELEDPEAK